MNGEMPKVRRTVYTVVIKRLLDISFSGFAIVILSPVFLVLCLLELYFHGWPILFAQERVGLHQKVFKLYKFRSMTSETDENGELLPGHQRLTAFGRFIRRFSLDELPELFCVFIGKMSIVGPRPLPTKYLSYYTKYHLMRHEVRPGLELVSLKPTKTWTWYEQFENDIWYLEHCSFWVDVRMIFGIARSVLRGADYRVEDTRTEFTPDYWKEEEKTSDADIGICTTQ